MIVFQYSRLDQAHTPSSRVEQRNRIRVHVDICAIERITGSVDRDHVRRADCTQTINVDVRV